VTSEEIYTHFRIPAPAPAAVSDLRPSWNVAPQSTQPVIRLNTRNDRPDWVDPVDPDKPDEPPTLF
jgi:hypothetical protein